MSINSVMIPWRVRSPVEVIHIQVIHVAEVDPRSSKHETIVSSALDSRQLRAVQSGVSPLLLGRLMSLAKSYPASRNKFTLSVNGIGKCA